MIPSIGRVVHYTLRDSDLKTIQHNRTVSATPYSMGNAAHEGDVFPAMIVRVLDKPASEFSVVQLQVFLDGCDQLWVTSAEQGTGPGKWFQPPTI
jgi:hypothetical protein